MKPRVTIAATAATFIRRMEASTMKYALRVYRIFLPYGGRGSGKKRVSRPGQHSAMSRQFFTHDFPNKVSRYWLLT